MFLALLSKVYVISYITAFITAIPFNFFIWNEDAKLRVRLFKIIFFSDFNVYDRREYRL